MEITAAIAAKSRVPDWVMVQCKAGSSPSCDAQRVDAVRVHGSRDVFIRYEAPDDELNDDNTVARLRVIKGDVHDPKDVIVQLSTTEGLLTLDITASKKTIEVVLLQKDQLQRVESRGSGDVVVEDNVLATIGTALSIAVLGSGDVYATTTEAVQTDTLTLNSKDSGRLQASFAELRVSKLRVQSYASGDVAVFVDSDSEAGNLSIVAEGPGDACLNWGAAMSVNQFVVQQVGAGDLSVGPRGSCQAARLSMQGSGQLDVGGVQCDNVDVDLVGSGDVIVQAANSLAVDGYGTGDVKFAGQPPHAFTNTGYRRLSPIPVESSYLPASCKRHKTPVIKAKYAYLSGGVLRSTSPGNVGVELDSAESSSSVAVGADAVGVVWRSMGRDKDNIVPLAAVVFLVAMVLRWFNNSRRRAREEQRHPLLRAQRRVAQNAADTVPHDRTSNRQLLLTVIQSAANADRAKSDSERLQFVLIYLSSKMDDVVFVEAAPYWTVHCTPRGGLCEQDQAFIVTVTGSYDVVLRYEALDSVGNGDVARVRVKSSSSSEPQNVAAQLLVIDGLPVLEISATEEKLDVLLLRKQRVQRVINQGAGDVSIGDNVLATGGPSLTIGAVGSGDVTLSTSSPVTVDELTLSAQGSGHLQGSFSEFDVKTLRLAVTSSGGATVLAGSTGAADSLTLTVQGSGSLCLSAGGLLETNHLKIKKIGSGDVSLGPRGSCQDAEVAIGGSGTIDIGGVQCHNVNVDLLGSGNVVVQATDSLSGDVYGSGHLHYFGAAPRSINNVNYMGLVVATPTSSSYHPSGCKSKPFPSFVAATTNSSNQSDGSGASDEFRYDLTIDQSNIVYLAGVVFLVGLVLRWFNESRRRAREEQRQPLIGAQRRVYV